MLVLKPSKIQGVGVFTTTKIRKGERPPLFARDWVFRKKCTGRQRHFCVPTKLGGYYCPKNYHRMSIGWYLNDAPTHINGLRTRPNCSSGTYPRALRHIQAGEELTIDYGKL